MKRWDVINWFVETFGYRSYLEIGCRRDDCFRRVKCEHKIGVDPREGGTHRMTSDEFFESNLWISGSSAVTEFDVVFIDGLHHDEQVLRDSENSLRCLSPNGVILIHDCLPETEESTRIVDANGKPILSPPDSKPWNGNVYRAMIEIRKLRDVDSITLTEDWGIGVVVKRENSQRLSSDQPGHWPAYEAYRERLLRTADWELVQQWAKDRLTTCSATASGESSRPKPR